MKIPTMTCPVKDSHLDEHRQLLDQNRYAATIIFSILERFLTIDSVLDLGCGIGAWLEAALVKPGRVVLGLDLEAFTPGEVVAPSETILNIAIDRIIELHRRFDLALCLETAEHIEAERAADLVSNCVRHSDVVLFSAAIPGQGGIHHVNEQPPEYWETLFNQADYEVVDLIRPLIWRDGAIPVWYRQNMLLFVNREAASTLNLLRHEASKTSIPLHRAHPDLFHWQKVRCEELQADLDAQREYSGGALSKAWRLIERLQNEREGLRAELRHLGQQLAAVEDALKTTQRDKLDLRESISWRVTGPLRALGALLQRLTRRERR